MTRSQRRRRKKKNTAGFTLLEALISMALMGLIIAALANVTAQWLPNWNHGMVRIQSHEHTALGLERIVADLAAAEFIPANRESRDPLFEGSLRSVTFVRIRAGHDVGPGLEIVRIAEDGNAQEPTIIRTRAPFAPMATDSMRRSKVRFTDPVVLLRAPYQLSFSYSGRDRIWRETWQELELPKAVRLTLRDIATQRILSVSTATTLHTDLPAACIGAKSFAACPAMLALPAARADGKSPS